jgi:hypothetical protein
MNVIRVAAKGAEIVAGIGIDTMITTAAKNTIPETYGVFGTAQKVCVKAGSIGLSMIATRALAHTIDEYLDELEEALG